MTDRQKLMISEYLPGDPDPDLEEGQYYFRQNDRVIKVWPLDVLPHRDGIEYGLYQQRAGRMVWIDSSGWGDRSRGVHFGYLYDNKEDCKNMTHDWVDEWEQLRKVQMNERTQTHDGG